MQNLLFAYIGPEVLMPLASVAAAVGGAVLMFGRRIIFAVKKVTRVITGSDHRKPVAASTTKPEPPVETPTD